MEAVREIAAPGRKAPDEVMVQILRATFESWSKLPGDPAPPFPELSEQEPREIRRRPKAVPCFYR